MAPSERLYVALYARGGHPTMAQKEIKHRFNGRAKGAFDPFKVPTWDMLENRERQA